MSTKVDPNFEVNLLPVISILAVCIAFLLLTAVWIPIGTLDVKQAIGESSDNKGQPSRFEIFMPQTNQYIITVEQSGKKIRTIKINDSTKNNADFSKAIEQLRQSYPDINMAFVTPSADTDYQNIVRLLETLNKHELKEIGIVPVM